MSTSDLDSDVTLKEFDFNNNPTHSNEETGCGQDHSLENEEENIVVYASENDPINYGPLQFTTTPSNSTPSNSTSLNSTSLNSTPSNSTSLNSTFPYPILPDSVSSDFPSSNSPFSDSVVPPVNLIKVKVYITGSESNPDLIRAFEGQSSDSTVQASVEEVNYEESDNYDPDYYTIYQCLLNSNENDFTIICKNTATTGYSSTQLYDTLGAALVNDYDVLYLANWVDRCDQFTDYKKIGPGSASLVNTANANGVLCLLFTPSGRDKFLSVYNIDVFPVKKSPTGQTLGHLLHNRLGLKTSSITDSIKLPPKQQKFYAKTIYPPVISFDFQKRASDAELIKMSFCRDTPNTTKPTSSNNNSGMGVFYFIVIVVILCIIVGLLIWAGSSTIRVNTNVPQYVIIPDNTIT